MPNIHYFMEGLSAKYCQTESRPQCEKVFDPRFTFCVQQPEITVSLLFLKTVKYPGHPLFYHSVLPVFALKLSEYLSSIILDFMLIMPYFSNKIASVSAQLLTLTECGTLDFEQRLLPFTNGNKSTTDSFND